MAGKASLLLVLGFSMLFLVFGHNFNSVSTRTVENFTDYYSKTVAHDLAVSGANLGANAVYIDNNWKAGYKNLKLNGGTVDVKIDVLNRSEEHTSELQSRPHLVCRLLLEKKKKKK